MQFWWQNILVCLCLAGFTTGLAQKQLWRHSHASGLRVQAEERLPAGAKFRPPPAESRPSVTDSRPSRTRPAAAERAPAIPMVNKSLAVGLWGVHAVLGKWGGVEGGLALGELRRVGRQHEKADDDYPIPSP